MNKRILATLIVTLICTVAISVLFTGCKKTDEAPQITENSETETAAPETPEIEYSSVLSLVCGDLLGKNEETVGLPNELVFLTGDNVIGYDYVSVGDVKGNLTCYLNESGIYSGVFGSGPYETQDAFSAALSQVNEIIAEQLGVEKKSPEFSGGDEEVDELESLFSGKGVMLAEYETDTAIVSVTGCGVNGIATIVVECRAVDGGVS